MTVVSHLRQLEAESISIFREVAAEFQKPAILYSIGKDSSVLLRLAEKAFYPGKFPFPLIHIDTGYKFKEMIEFRDRYAAQIGATLIVHRNEPAIQNRMNPWQFGTDKCCGALKTGALLQALEKYEIDAAIGGARRDEEKSRAKERIFSLRDEFGQWDPKNQRPEPWNIFNTRINKGENMRVFPISNWTEVDVWNYIALEKIPIVPLYFAQERPVIDRGGILIPVLDDTQIRADEAVVTVMSRFRSLGCSPCTGAIRSSAQTVEAIIEETIVAKRSERENRIIDFSSESSMEEKKREGYF